MQHRAARSLDGGGQARGRQLVGHPAEGVCGSDGAGAGLACGQLQLAHDRHRVVGPHPHVRAVGAHRGEAAVDRDLEVGVEPDRPHPASRGHAQPLPSEVVMRRVPLSRQTARGASVPVSRGTSTTMSTSS